MWIWGLFFSVLLDSGDFDNKNNNNNNNGNNTELDNEYDNKQVDNTDKILYAWFKLLRSDLFENYKREWK